MSRDVSRRCAVTKAGACPMAASDDWRLFGVDVQSMIPEALWACLFVIDTLDQTCCLEILIP